MGTTYDYSYDYNVRDSNKTHRSHANAPRGTENTTGQHTQRTTGHHSLPGASFNRSSNVDPLLNLQHDRIWNKLYDPIGTDKATHGTEIQVRCMTFLR